EDLIRMICAARPRKVVYVSCNPATLVRDLAIFQTQGYHTGEIFPFDMFPQTHHVESLVALEPGPPG
ncbi:MAG: 23S rRNA (uracil-5-)-methyltransferase RumA, partial [Calditrichaeota bacterium]|nr:23S rRNA (uracil-5-)-methyltransferase RumA [Calditrichota bacterium]